ncbi:MAG: hypothetical protein ACLPZR_05385, partial [Solirubrobacteraceae bacterium]
MNPYTDELARLRAANPERVEPEHGLTPAATATLARILHEPIDEATEARSGGHSRARCPGRRIVSRSSRLIVVLAATVIAGGAALAATDPLGWWSANPTYARYGSNPAVRVHTPTARLIACARSGEVLRCLPATYEPVSGVELVNGHRSTAQLYTFIDAIRPPAHGFTRRAVLADIARRRAGGAMSAAQAARFRADLAAVPDSFFTEFELATRYGTYGVGGETRDGLTLVPPAGIPSLVVCEPADRGLSCQNLNGDGNAPVGAGVYGAMTARSWRYQRVPPENGG